MNARPCSPSWPRLECGRNCAGPKVANVTAAAKSQANILRTMIIAKGYPDYNVDTQTCDRRVVNPASQRVFREVDTYLRLQQHVQFGVKILAGRRARA